MACEKVDIHLPPVPRVLIPRVLIPKGQGNHKEELFEFEYLQCWSTFDRWIEVLV